MPVLLVGLMLVPTPAAAQSHDPVAAEALFRQGRDAMKKGDWPTACAKFEESQRLDAAAGTLLNLAECEQKLGRIASAWQHYQEATDLLPSSDPRFAIAKRAAQAIAPRVPKLTITLDPSAPPDTRVARDEVELGSGSLGTALPVDPGAHVIVVTAPGHEARKLVVRLEAGAVETIDVAPGEKIAASDPTPKRKPTGGHETPPEVPRSSNAQRTVGWVVAGVGVLGGAIGATYFGFAAKDKDGEARRMGCDDTTCPDDASLAVSNEHAKLESYALYCALGGGALMAGGLALVLTAPSARKTDEAAISVRAVALPGTTTVQLSGAW